MGCLTIVPLDTALAPDVFGVLGSRRTTSRRSDAAPSCSRGSCRTIPAARSREHRAELLRSVEDAHGAHPVDLTADVAGVLSATQGGTAQAAYAVGDVLAANTTTSLLRVATVGAGSVFASKGFSAPPAWDSTLFVGTDIRLQADAHIHAESDFSINTLFGIDGAFSEIMSKGALRLTGRITSGACTIDMGGGGTQGGGGRTVSHSFNCQNGNFLAQGIGQFNGTGDSYFTGDLGIGVTNPGAKLEVAGQVKITDGSEGAGKVLTSDVAGLATWETPAGGSGDFSNTGEAGGADRTLGNTDNFDLGLVTNNATRLHLQNDGNVGIGTIGPSATLQVGDATFSGAFGSNSIARNGFLVGEGAGDGTGLVSLQISSNYNHATFPNYGLVLVNGPSLVPPALTHGGSCTMVLPGQLAVYFLLMGQMQPISMILTALQYL